MDSGKSLTLNIIYDAKSCVVPFPERSDIILFTIKQNNTTISAGHTSVGVRKTRHDYLNLALRRFKKSMTILAGVLSIITTGILASLWGFGLPYVIVDGAVLFLGIFCVATIVASLILAFALENEAIAEGRHWH